MTLPLDSVVNGDCLAVLRDLPDHSVDLVVTSPPYNNWRNRRTQAAKADYWARTNIVYDGFDDKMDDDEYAANQVAVLNELSRVLKPSGTIAYNHKDQIHNFVCRSPLEWILQSDLVLRQRITWDRCGMQAFNNVRFYRCDEDIYLLGRNAKGFKWNKDAAQHMSVWRIPPSKNIYGHPATFPLEIPARLIEAFTEPGDVVLDPYAGSGTTLVAAQKAHRRFIGIELSEDYCRISNERLGNPDAPYSDDSLFAATLLDGDR